MAGCIAQLFGCWSALAEEPVLKMVGPHFAPYYFYNEKKEIDGAIVRILDEIAGHAGLSWTGELVPPRRIVHMLKTGKANVSLLVKNPIFESDEQVLRGTEPVAEMVLNVYRRKATPEIKEKAQLRGQKVIVIHKFGYGGFKAWLEDQENKVSLLSVNRYDQAIRMLENGRADYLILYDVNFEEGLEMLKRPAGNLTYSNINRVPLYIHVSRNGTDNPVVLLERLQSSYRKLKASGALRDSQRLPEEVVAPLEN